ncbi:MAG: dnaC1 [Candidatus Magasanikbacteria bacterium]|nr:dnaC1 [Candidatus Magasanikbacteria bacterium]
MANSPSIIAKIPPHNLEAEASLLGSLLIDKEALVRVADMITPTDFYRDAHAMIFEAMLDLYAKREPIDILSVGNRLEEKKYLEQIGGRSFLVQLANGVPTAAHVHHYAAIVGKKAMLRRLILAAGEITRLGYEEAEDVEKILDEAQKQIFSVTEKSLRQNFIVIRDVLTEAFDRIDELHREKGKLRGLPTGFTQLDNLLGGLQKSDLVVLAARPSVGKTSLALDIVRHAAVRQKAAVALFSLEMSKEQLVDRLLCAEAGVDLWKMRTGRLSDRAEDDDFPRIGAAMGTLAEAPIYIDDSPMSSVVGIRTKARRLQAQHGLGLIVIDYLQLMESRTQIENRVLEIGEITRSLKGIARELNVPVLALSQLSRAVEMSKPAIPKLAHLRESGSIEQDSDVVMFIYRKAADRGYRSEDIPPDEKKLAEIHIAKHRNGPTGQVNLFWDETRASFKNMERMMYNAGGMNAGAAVSRPALPPR